MDIQTIVGPRVRQLRRERGWTQAGLAERLQGQSGIDQSMVAKIEKGKRRLKLEDLLVLAAALNTSPVYLLTPEDPDALVTIGTEEHPAYVVRNWIRGFDPLPGADRRDYAKAMPFDDRVFVTDPNLAGFVSTVQSQARARAQGNHDEWQELETIRRGAIVEMIAADEGYPIE